jgi:hypothetical protein
MKAISGMKAEGPKVIMVSHQHPGMDPPPRSHARLAQRLEEQLPVVIVPENRLSPIAPCHHVIEGSGILNANAAGHRKPFLREATLSRIDA